MSSKTSQFFHVLPAKCVWLGGPQSPNNIDLGPLSDENQADSDEDDELLVNSTSSDEEEDCDDQ